ETGVVDFVLPIRDLAKRLTDLIRIKEIIWPPEMGSLDEEVLRRILAHLRIRTGHDFSKYKQSTVVRRLARRMQVNRINVLKDYYDLIRDNVDEVQALLSDLLIFVTSFFATEKHSSHSRRCCPRFSPVRSPANRSASGSPDALLAKRPTRSGFSCWKKLAVTMSVPNFRYSVPILTFMRLRQREKDVIPLRSRLT